MPERDIFCSSSLLSYGCYTQSLQLVQEKEQDGAGEEGGPVLSEEDMQYVMTEEHMQPGG